jgi:hypothetical protein
LFSDTLQSVSSFLDATLTFLELLISNFNYSSSTVIG